MPETTTHYAAWYGPRGPSDAEGLALCVVFAIAGALFGYLYRRVVLRRRLDLTTVHFGWCVHGALLVSLAVRLVESWAIGGRSAVDGMWVYAWITPFTLGAMWGFRRADRRRTARPINDGIQATEGGLLLVSPLHHRADRVPLEDLVKPA